MKYEIKPGDLVNMKLRNEGCYIGGIVAGIISFLDPKDNKIKDKYAIYTGAEECSLVIEDNIRDVDIVTDYKQYHDFVHMFMQDIETFDDLMKNLEDNWDNLDDIGKNCISFYLPTILSNRGF